MFYWPCLMDLRCQTVLGNTYHLENRPGSDLMKELGGLHRFNNWSGATLTDSGGFQMVSLLDLAEISVSNTLLLANNLLLTKSTKFPLIIRWSSLWDNLGPTKKEDGVTFQSPIDGQQMMLTPERSIQIQNGIGADIIMALDDVVSSVHHESSRFEEATRRTLRWIDRCVAAHRRPSEQALFGIIQGGLDQTLRDVCVEGAVLDFNLSK